VRLMPSEDRAKSTVWFVAPPMSTRSSLMAYTRVILQSGLAKITHSEVSAWVQSLAAEGLSPASVRYAHRVLSRALAAAVRDGRLVRNVAEGVPLPRVVGEAKRFLTHDEVQRLGRLVNRTGR
jgi:integrase